VFGLPPKALSALIDLKKELLSKDSTIDLAEVESEGSPVKTYARPSRKKLRPQVVNAFQRGCQRREFWSPIH